MIASTNYVEIIKTFTAHWCALSADKRQSYMLKADIHEASILSSKRKRNSGQKQSPSAYMLFCLDKRAELTKEQPNLSFGEIGRTLGQLWNSLSDASRQVYNDLSSLYNQ